MKKQLLMAVSTVLLMSPFALGSAAPTPSEWAKVREEFAPKNSISPRVPKRYLGKKNPSTGWTEIVRPRELFAKLAILTNNPDCAKKDDDCDGFGMTTENFIYRPNGPAEKLISIEYMMGGDEGRGRQALVLISLNQNHWFVLPTIGAGVHLEQALAYVYESQTFIITGATVSGGGRRHIYEIDADFAEDGKTVKIFDAGYLAISKQKNRTER